MTLRRMLILGDSTALPRSHHGQHIEETWPARVSCALAHELWNWSRVGATSREMLALAQSASDMLSEFDLVIIAVGLVDGMPRPLWYRHSFYRYVSERLGRGWVRRANACARASLRAGCASRQWVNVGEYAANIDAIRRLCVRQGVARVLLIGVPTLIERALASRLSCRIEFASAYNNALRLSATQDKEVRYVSIAFPDEVRDEMLMADGQHLTSTGHCAVAEAIIGAI